MQSYFNLFSRNLMNKERCIVYYIAKTYKSNRDIAKKWKSLHGEDEIYHRLLVMEHESWNILETSRRILYDIEL